MTACSTFPVSAASALRFSVRRISAETSIGVTGGPPFTSKRTMEPPFTKR